MMYGRIHSLSIVAAALLSSTVVVLAEDEKNTCGLYLAISSTSTVEETNWGIFAGRDYQKGEPIGSPEVSITVPHLRANLGTNDNKERQLLEPTVDFFERFFWVTETSASQFDITAGKSVSAIPGAGVLAGYMPKRTNADWNVTAPYRRPADGDATVAHANRGAYSPYHNVQVTSITKIVSGSEIFMEFGDSWSEENGEEKEELTTDDFLRVDETIAQMIGFFDKHKGTLSEDSKEEVYSFLKNDVMKAAVGTDKARQIASLLPPNPDDLRKIPEAGGALPFSNPTVFRTKDWLDTYGLCIDNIRSGKSTIPNAGRGAFATRPLAAGSFIAPVPLTHITDKKVFDMHTLHQNDNGEILRVGDTPIGKQLFLNYCLGHPESTMLFFPSSPAVPFINHSDEPNAKLVWSKHPNHQKLWLNLSPEELLEEENMYLGLLLELVALRDISPDEEVLIDYGADWKAAFAQHTEQWNTGIAAGTIPSTWPYRAADMNAMFQDKPFTTGKKVFPENVQLKAFLQLSDSEAKGTLEDPREWADSDEETAFGHDNLFDVNVLAYNEEERKYTVEWFRGPTNSAVVTGVPHNALIFVDQPGTSDMFLPQAFRHPIGIPDEIFPKAWRNLEA